jgi:hypothetical protein
MISSLIKFRAFSDAFNGQGKNTRLTLTDLTTIIPSRMRLCSIFSAPASRLDLANHTIKAFKMGIPTSSGESFDLLRQQYVIGPELSEKLKKMIHFRNTIIHQYQKMDVEIVKSVIGSGLDDLIEFGDRILAFINGPVSA